MAVTLLLITLYDGHIVAWEAGLLVAMYAFYVTIVVFGSWWERRRERKRNVQNLVRSEYRQEELPPFTEPYTDNRKSRLYLSYFLS
jgi:sodium/potassium/calcium exchanger 6